MTAFGKIKISGRYISKLQNLGNSVPAQSISGQKYLFSGETRFYNAIENSVAVPKSFS